MLNSVIFWKLLDIFILIIEWISLYILINDLSIKKVSKNQSFFSFLLILGIAFAMNLLGIFPNVRVFISIMLSILYVKLNYEVLEFVSGEDLLSNYPNNIDLLFLDIQMNGLNGMDVARRIREFDNNVEIIFTTSVLDYVCEGYEVNAYRYMLKPIEYNIFKNNMGKCIENIIKKKNDFLTINDKSKLIKIKFDDILYIETSKRQLIIHTINGHEIIKMSIRKLEKLLNKDFFRCHNSFIVNLEKINKIDVSDIYINNATIPISKYRRKQLKARLIEVLGDKLC